MQLKIAKQLNYFLIFIFLIMVALGIAVFYYAGKYPDMKILLIGIFLAVGVALLVFYRWLETYWDKNIITRMAQNQKIALANIKVGKRIGPMRDSSFTNYWLYEFDAILYDTKTHTPFEKTFYEKMSRKTDAVPSGSVYVTYDEDKPSQLFVLPTALISHLPILAPIVQQYEDDKNLKIRYLDVYYDKGIVIKTFRESVAEHVSKKQMIEEMEEEND